MTLPIPTSYPPMEALLVDQLPNGEEWQYEPKWDGFRCLVHRDGEAIELMSKAGKPLSRYFPELVESIRGISASRFVIDGEIVIPHGGSLSFDHLLMRIHPAASRVKRLAIEHPATLIVFDILVDAKGDSLVELPFSARREALDAFVGTHVPEDVAVHLSPSTDRKSVV